MVKHRRTFVVKHRRTFVVKHRRTGVLFVLMSIFKIGEAKSFTNTRLSKEGATKQKVSEVFLISGSDLRPREDSYFASFGCRYPRITQFPILEVLHATTRNQSILAWKHSWPFSCIYYLQFLTIVFPSDTPSVLTIKSNVSARN